MKILALVTEKVVTQSSPIRFISYLREGDVVSVMASHSPTWEMSELRQVDWSDFESKTPEVQRLIFDQGNWLLSRTPNGDGWQAQLQKPLSSKK